MNFKKYMKFDFYRSKLIFIVIFFLYFLFLFLNPQYHHNHQNVSRLEPALNFVQNGEFTLSGIWPTIDKSLFNGEYYTDKPIGLSVLMIPFIYFINFIFQEESPRAVFRASYVILTSIVTPTFFLFSSYILYKTSKKIFSRNISCLYSTFSYSFCSLAYLWTNTLFAHSITSSLLLILTCNTFSFIFDKKSLEKNSSYFSLFMMGIISGLAFTIEIQSILASTFILLITFLSYFFIIRNAISFKNFCVYILLILFGFMVAYLPSMIYYILIYGKPFYISYNDVVGFEGMQEGFFGITIIDFEVLKSLFFGKERGLFLFSPISILYPIGFIGFMIQKKICLHKRLFIGLIAIFVCFLYIYINSSYFYWNGGWSTGPRHLIPFTGVTSLIVGSLFEFDYLNFSKKFKSFFEFFLIYFLGFSNLYVSLLLSADTFAPDNYLNPLTEYLLPRALDLSSISLINIFISFLSSSLIMFILHENLNRQNDYFNKRSFSSDQL